MSQIIRILGFSIAIIGVLGSFQNCGENKGFFPNRLAYTPISKIQDDFAQTYAGRLTANSCAVSASYICDEELFSESLEREDVEANYDCLNIAGVELCPSGLTRTYNSSMSTGPKEYSRYYCYYNLADMDGIYPIQASADDLETALGETYNLCLDLASR